MDSNRSQFMARQRIESEVDLPRPAPCRACSVGSVRAATGKSLRQVLKGLNGQAREKPTKESLRSNHPDMPRKMVKLKQIAGEMPRRDTSAEVSSGTIMQMLDAVGAVSSVAGSVRSGNIRIIAVGLYEEISE